MKIKMEIRKDISISLLTEKSVSIVTKEYITINGVEQQLGKTKRICYNNCPYDRQRMQSSLPEEHVNKILSIWGDKALFEDVEPDTSNSH